LANSKWWSIGDIWQKIFNEGNSKIKVESSVVDSSLPSGASTSAKQDVLIAKDFATQTTLAAILAKLIAAPSTEAKQDVLISYVDGLESLLTAINDTSGIKKIVDQLPAGTNQIGTVGITALPSIPSGSNLIGSVNATIVGGLPNQTLVEQLTDADAVLGVLTFFENIYCIEIYNTDMSNIGVFVVNGISITVPPNKVITTIVGGTPSPIVTITGAITYIVTRYE